MFCFAEHQKGSPGGFKLLDLTSERSAWSEALAPSGEGFERESFATWWTRHGASFAHLEPRIVEQWVYRHWEHTPFAMLPLHRLSWRLERWPTERILRDVYARGDMLDVVHDYKTFTEYGTHPTLKAFEKLRTWDYPIVLLSTPAGLSGHEGDRPDVRCLLIEGHLRRRVLNMMATLRRSELAPEHEVFVLSLADADPELPNSGRGGLSTP